MSRDTTVFLICSHTWHGHVFFSMKFVITPHVHAQIRQMRQVPYLEEAPHQGSKKQILFSFCFSFSASSMKREKCERHGFQNADVTWQCGFSIQALIPRSRLRQEFADVIHQTAGQCSPRHQIAFCRAIGRLTAFHKTVKIVENAKRILHAMPRSANR